MRFVRAFLFFAQALVCLGASAANELEHVWLDSLKTAEVALSAAKTPEERREAAQVKAAALNSLGRHTEALAVINEAIARDGATGGAKLTEIKAKVLFASGDFEAALALVNANIAEIWRLTEELRKKPMPGAPVDIWLRVGRENFIVAVYCNVALHRWDAALRALGFFFDPDDDDNMGYRLNWYLALRKLGAPSSSFFEKNLLTYRAREKPTYRAYTLKMEEQAISEAEVLRFISDQGLKPSEAQEANSEALFFSAMTQDDESARRDTLRRLDELAPYGSSEWIVAKHLFKK